MRAQCGSQSRHCQYNIEQGCHVVYLSAIFANFGLMEKLLAKWKNPIRPLPKVAESGLIESIWAE
jgi:hypothetical protein